LGAAMKALILNLSVFSFFTGWTSAIFKVLPIALFLSEGSTKDLALLFLIATVLLPIFGFTLEVLRKQLSPSSFSVVLKVLNPTLLISLFSCYLLFPLYVTAAYFVVLQTSLATNNYLNLASTYTTFLSLSESKKYYGYLSGSKSAGRLGGNLLLPLIMSYFGNFLTLIILIFSQFILAFLDLIIEKTNKERLFSLLQQKSSNKTKVNKNSLKSPFILLSFSFVIITTVGSRITDLSGYKITQELFESKEEITTFLCYFFLSISVLEIFSNLFVFKSSLRSLGLYATQYLPLVIIVVFIVMFTVLYQLFPTKEFLYIVSLGSWFLFYFGRSSYMTFCAQMSYDSLPLDQKTFVRSSANYIVSPIGGIIGNGLYTLILFLYGFSYPIIFSCIISVCVLGTVVSVLCKPFYIKNIRKLLSKNISSTEDFVLSKEGENYINSQLDIKNEKEALYILGQARHGSPKILENVVTRCFSSPHISIIKTALSIHVKTPSSSYLTAVRELTSHHKFVIQIEAVKVMHLHDMRLFSEDQTYLKVMSPLYLFELLCFNEASDYLWNELKKLSCSHPREGLRILKRLHVSEKREELLQEIILSGNSPIYEKALYSLSLIESNFPFYYDLLENRKIFPYLLNKLIYEKESSLPFLKFCVEKEGVYSPLFLKLFPLLKLQPLEEVSDWIFVGLAAPFGTPLFEMCLDFYTSSALLKIRPSFAIEKLQENKNKCAEFISLLYQLFKSIPEATGAQKSILIHLKKYENILFNFFTIEYKDPIIRSFTLWDPNLDPYKKGFIQEWIYCSFSREDLNFLEEISMKTLSQEQLQKKLLNNPLVSDLLKATVVYTCHPKIKIDVSKESFPLTYELLKA
jgi:hypothetical protein